MIQRIQSLYLLMTTILPLLFLKGSFLKFINKTGSEILFRFDGIFQTNPDNGLTLIRQNIPIPLITILITVLSLIAIFLYKKRKIQLRITLATIIMTVILIGLIIYYSYSVTDEFQAVLVPLFKMFIPVLILVFGILAYRGIKKDEDLVSSYYRLR
jgi:glucan phosphoethanolaminetransferase (alkaline phosphatase superfamily)